MSEMHSRLTGQLTILSAVALLVSLVFLLLFFTLGGVFGTLNDLFSIFQVTLMLPALLFFAVRLRLSNPAIALAAAALGAVGIVLTAVVQTLLVIGLLPYEQTVAPNMIGGGLIGVWLILSSALSMRASLLRGALPWFGVAAGVGYVILVIGFSLGGQNHPLFAAGGGLTVLAYPIWAIWLGRRLIDGKISAGI